MDNTALRSKALNFAAIKHMGQYRKGGEPYIYHPIAVANKLEDYGFDTDLYYISAVFHDLLEDTDATEDDIRKYGEDVLEVVKLLTKNKSTSTKKYLRLISQNEVALNIKLADRLSNLYDMYKSNDEDFIERYLNHTKRYYLDLAQNTVFYKEMQSYFIR